MFHVDMDSFVWQEKQFNLKIDLTEIPQKVSAYYTSRIADLEKDLQKLSNTKNMLVLKLKELQENLVILPYSVMACIYYDKQAGRHASRQL
jgi:hypothetical protein